MRVRIPISALALLTFAIATAAMAAAARQADAEEFTAVSANVREPGHPVRIVVLEWSSDEDRERLAIGLDPPPPEPAPEASDGRGRGRGGRGGRGRGGRGAEPVDPVLAALSDTATVGYIWTDQVAGYPIRYANRVSLPVGGEQIVLVTNRRLGVHTTAWDPVATDYEFTLIEIRLDANGEGEGKTSLTTHIVVDADTGVPVLDDYQDTLVVLENVRR